MSWRERIGQLRAEGRTRWFWMLPAIVLVVAGVWCDRASRGSAQVSRLRVDVVARYPHDRQAFTQGLLWHEGKVYESTGRYRQSSLRRVDLASGNVERTVSLDDDLFAEGLAQVGDRLIQLTWRAGRAIVWDLATLEPTEEFEYPGEGWGLCYDGARLMMSSGSDRLVFRDPRTFRKLGEVQVTDNGEPVRHLNELECVNGAVYANVWTTDTIVRIDPDSGEVTATIDAAGLLPREDRLGGEDVLNGIAYVPERERFLLTGKNWPYVYEVEFVPAPDE